MDIEQTLEQMTLAEKADLCSGADFWRTKPIERLGIESIMMSDGPSGLRKQAGDGDHMGINESIPAVCFPAPVAIASSFDPALARTVGETMGRECQAEGLAMLLSPGMNIKRTPLCGRSFEYYSEDPYLTGQMGVATVQGIQSQGAASCVKHFAANNQEKMRMAGDSVVDERTLHEIYLSAFETVVKEARPRSVMCAYNRVNGTFMAENRELLTDVLRDKWGFDGFVVTDWGAVKNQVKGIQAGLDLEMPGGSKAGRNRILAALEDESLTEAELDDTVRRLLTMIDQSVRQQKTGVAFDREADYAIARDAARECAVLLKNDNDILPLDDKGKIAFIGSFAERPRYQGSGSSHINSARVSSALSAVQDLDVHFAQSYTAAESKTDQMLLAEAVELARQSEAAVIFVGLPDRFETEGVDRKTLDMPDNQITLIETVAKAQPKTVVVLHHGAPITMPWADKVPAILEMYLSGDGVGEATVDLLFGRSNPSGRLAETFPLSLTDTPAFLNTPDAKGRVEYREGIFVGYRYYDIREMDVLYPFGHGLSYTHFEYTSLKFDKARLDDTQTLSVSVTVKNIGHRTGKEVVQLYVKPVDSQVSRPVRELKGFAKIELQPGETRQVTFRIDKMAFAYYEPLLRDWHVESGDYTIEIGSSSRDIRLDGTVSVTSTVRIPVVFTRYSMMGEILKTPVGQRMAEQMQAQRGDEGSSDVDALGEGASGMAEAMKQELPLEALISYGVMTEEQLDGLLAALQQNS